MTWGKPRLRFFVFCFFSPLPVVAAVAILLMWTTISTILTCKVSSRINMQQFGVLVVVTAVVFAAGPVGIMGHNGRIVDSGSSGRRVSATIITITATNTIIIVTANIESEFVANHMNDHACDNSGFDAFQSEDKSKRGQSNGIFGGGLLMTNLDQPFVHEIDANHGQQ